MENESHGVSNTNRIHLKDNLGTRIKTRTYEAENKATWYRRRRRRGWNE
jgi:hypothetical protein